MFENLNCGDHAHHWDHATQHPHQPLCVGVGGAGGVCSTCEWQATSHSLGGC